MAYTCNVKANVKGRRKLKSWIEMNVLCIVDQEHQRWVIVEDNTIKFKAIWLIVNSPFIG